MQVFLNQQNDQLRTYFHGDPEIPIEESEYDYIKIPEPTLEVDTSGNYIPNINSIKLFINT